MENFFFFNEVFYETNPKKTLTLDPRSNQERVKGEKSLSLHAYSRPCPVGNHPWGLFSPSSASGHTMGFLGLLVFWRVWDLNPVPHTC